MLSATIRAVAYSRVSTEEQAYEGYSIDAQQRALRAHCEAQGWRVVESLADEGLSGTLAPSARPGLARALELLRSKRADVLVIHKLDRLARSIRIANELIEEFQRLGVALVAVADRIDLSTPFGWASFQMQNVFNQLYIENLRFETRKGWAERAAQGGWVGHPPLGYRRAGTTLELSDDAPTIELIYQLYSTGQHSYQTLADSLNAAGHRTRDARTGQRGLFGRESVRTILRNRAYIGYTSAGGTEYQGAHPPLIDDALWQRCAQIREARERDGTLQVSPAIPDVFPKTVYCLSCGSRCQHGSSGRATSRRAYYRCGARSAAGSRRLDCGAAPASAARIEQQVVELLASLEISTELRQALVDEAARAVAVQGRPQQQVDRAALEGKLSRVAELYADGIISREEYQRRAAELRRQIEAPAPQIRANADLDAVLALLVDVPNLVRAATPAELRAIVAPMLSHIWVQDGWAVAVTPRAEFEQVFRGIWQIGAGQDAEKRCLTGFEPATS